eukprot:5375322-Pyramimonas_sp.AAC.1
MRRGFRTAYPEPRPCCVRARPELPTWNSRRAHLCSSWSRAPRGWPGRGVRGTTVPSSSFTNVRAAVFRRVWPCVDVMRAALASCSQFPTLAEGYAVSPRRSAPGASRIRPRRSSNGTCTSRRVEQRLAALAITRTHATYFSHYE